MIDADRPPSHHELSELFKRAGLHPWDPGSGTGKLKRARAVLFRADNEAPNRGRRLIGLLVQTLQAGGAFVSTSSTYVGAELLGNAQAAFRQHGWDMSDDGALRPLLLDAVAEDEWGPALATMVVRARTGSQDAALVTGTGKDLLEGAARQVLVAHGGSYDERLGFAGTMFQAFTAIGLTPLTPQEVGALRKTLSPDSRRQLEQVLYLLSLAVNELRNSDGTGHGRPFLPSVTAAEARTAVEAMALIAELMLERKS